MGPSWPFVSACLFNLPTQRGFVLSTLTLYMKSTSEFGKLKLLKGLKFLWVPWQQPLIPI